MNTALRDGLAEVPGALPTFASPGLEARAARDRPDRSRLAVPAAAPGGRAPRSCRRHSPVARLFDAFRLDDTALAKRLSAAVDPGLAAFSLAI